MAVLRQILSPKDIFCPFRKGPGGGGKMSF